jgi:hypothetical protein
LYHDNTAGEFNFGDQLQHIVEMWGISLEDASEQLQNVDRQQTVTPHRPLLPGDGFAALGTTEIVTFLATDSLLLAQLKY